MKIFRYKVLLLMLMILLFVGCSTKKVSKFSSLDKLVLPTKNYDTNKEKDTALSFATINPILTINFNASNDLHRSLEKRLKNSLNQLSCKIPTEIKKVLISKGITITDNYWSRNDMTFSQKRDTSTLFYPVIQIYIDQNTIDTLKSIDNSKPKKVKTSGKFEISAKVELVSLEPLSGEKIWLKSLPLQRKKFTTSISYKGKLLQAKNVLTIDNRVVSLASEIDSLIIEIYQKIIEGVEKYVDYEEFMFLNKDIIKVKKIKRY